MNFDFDIKNNINRLLGSLNITYQIQFKFVDLLLFKEENSRLAIE